MDVYLTASAYRGEQPSLAAFNEVDGQNIVYFGGQNPGELLAQFEALRGERSYDAVLVLTDSSAYELGPAQAELAVPQAPIWMVHLASGIPLGYDDATLEAIQSSGGGVVGSLDEALQRLAVSLAGKGTGQTGRDMLDGYLWSVLPTVEAETIAKPEAPGSGFDALAARRLILAEMQRQGGELKDLDVLDRLHAIAKTYSLVTPYSSFLVLVNDAQQYRLENAEERADRFEREHEAIGETTPPNQLPLTGVPEPEEWLLIITATAVLVWAATRKGIVKAKVSLAALAETKSPPVSGLINLFLSKYLRSEKI